MALAGNDDLRAVTSLMYEAVGRGVGSNGGGRERRAP